MTDSSSTNPVLTFEGKRYDLNSLPDELKELVRGMQVADAQLRMHEDTLKVLAVGRQSLAMQLNEKIQNVQALPDEGQQGRFKKLIIFATFLMILERSFKPPFLVF